MWGFVTQTVDKKLRTELIPDVYSDNSPYFEISLIAGTGEELKIFLFITHLELYH